MAANNTFEFGEFTLRPAMPDDFGLAQLWTTLDPDHADRIDPYFWLGQGPNYDAYLLSDSKGPLFFCKLILSADWDEVEIHMQFPPPEGQRVRIARGLVSGVEWLERVLKQMHVRQLCFDSVSESLIAFCVKRLGFTPDGKRLRKWLGSA